jgi:hypothetical protein
MLHHPAQAKKGRTGEGAAQIGGNAIERFVGSRASNDIYDNGS